MSENKCISCIKDKLTGECYDIKDKIAREKLATLKSGTQLYKHVLPFNTRIKPDPLYNGGGVRVIPCEVSFVSYNKNFTAQLNTSGKKICPILPKKIEILNLDGVIYIDEMNYDVTKILDGNIYYLKNTVENVLICNQHIYYYNGGDLADLELDKLYLNLKKMKYTIEGTTFIFEGEPL